MFSFFLHWGGIILPQYGGYLCGSLEDDLELVGEPEFHRR